MLKSATKVKFPAQCVVRFLALVGDGGIVPVFYLTPKTLMPLNVAVLMSVKPM